MRQCVPELLDVGQLEAKSPEQAADARLILFLEALPTPLGKSIRSPMCHIKIQGCMTEQLLQNHAYITCLKPSVKHLFL